MVTLVIIVLVIFNNKSKKTQNSLVWIIFLQTQHVKFNIRFRGDTFDHMFLYFQVKEGMFDKERFDDLCWMMTMKKNFNMTSQRLLLSERDCFKLFCLFNLLSEDSYPLVMITEEVKDAPIYPPTRLYLLSCLFVVAEEVNGDILIKAEKWEMCIWW